MFIFSGAGGSGISGELGQQAPRRPPRCQVQLGGWAPLQEGGPHGQGWWSSGVPRGGCVPRAHSPAAVSPGVSGRLPSSRPGPGASALRGRRRAPLGQQGQPRQQAVRAWGLLRGPEGPGVTSECRPSKRGSLLQVGAPPDEPIWSGGSALQSVMGHRGKERNRSVTTRGARGGDLAACSPSRSPAALRPGNPSCNNRVKDTLENTQSHFRVEPFLVETVELPPRG